MSFDIATKNAVGEERIHLLQQNSPQYIAKDHNFLFTRLTPFIEKINKT